MDQQSDVVAFGADPDDLDTPDVFARSRFE